MWDECAAKPRCWFSRPRISPDLIFSAMTRPKGPRPNQVSSLPIGELQIPEKDPSAMEARPDRILG
jgi:hypothetical protein